METEPSQSSAEHQRPGTLVHDDGRVELSGDMHMLEESPLYNEDLAPLKLSQRNWSTYNYAALWAAMCACIPTYMISSGLIASGMNWWQAIITVLLGNTIVLLPILANSHPGTKYGIPFPVFARASYGTFGSNLPAIMRAVVACGWFGIQAWIGGQAIDGFFKALIPGWHTLLGAQSIEGHALTEWLSFAIFWSLNILIIYKGMDLLKKVQGIAAPFVLVMTICLAYWAVSHAHGLGDMLAQKSKYKSLSEFLPVFIPSLTAMIGFWATLSLNMPDFTRFGRSQKEQTIGQAVALPLAMAVFSALSIIITSAALEIYPNVPPAELWDPVKLISRFENPFVVAIAMFTVSLATLSVNIAANVVSPANDFANAFPKYITFKRGGLITGVAGLILQPWKLIADPSGYIFTWLLGYSGGLGSIAGILIVDYWIVRKKQLQLPDLYLNPGVYTFNSGWNPAAVIATIIGCASAWIGAIFPPAHIFYEYGWFVGLFVSGLVYWLMMNSSRTAAN
jgi:NCS1 family nucleobase:cation symporter-1